MRLPLSVLLLAVARAGFGEKEGKEDELQDEVISANLDDPREMQHRMRMYREMRERDQAVQKGLVYMLSKIGPAVSCRKPFDQTDLADTVSNLMFSSTHRPQVGLALADYRKRCDTHKMRTYLRDKALGHIQRGQLRSAVVVLQYRQKILGAPRQPLQHQCQQACTKYVESRHRTSTSAAKFAFKALGALPLLKRFGAHGDWDFSWTLSDSTDRIEEFEDFFIRTFDIVMWGLAPSSCGLPLFDLEARFLKVLRDHIRPYPHPRELVASPSGEDFLYRTLYFITHLVYYVTNWAATKVRIEMEMEKQFLSQALEFCTRTENARYGACDELDITGEVIDSLMLIGEADDHPVVNNKRREIIRRQSEDGSWISGEDDDDECLHSTYNSINGLVHHDREWLQSGLVTSTVPPEAYRLDPHDLDAAFRKSQLIPAGTGAADER
jgi:hypothetical protein